jgi:hypothetical protein
VGSSQSEARVTPWLRRSAHILLWALIVGTFPSKSPGAHFTQYVQQGQKLVGNGFSGTAPQQGTSVAASGDGNTVIVGGPGDIDPTTGAQVGAAWIFTRTNGVWSQQGAKLVGTGAAQQGTSVAISADGNTVLIGGPADNASIGAAWVFTRTNGVWSQDGQKLIGTDAAGPASQGTAVALSADGNTAIIGGPNDNGENGAVWFWTRSNGMWTQQGAKVTDNEFMGRRVAISGDGSTAAASAAMGTPIFTNNGGVWTLQQHLPFSVASGALVSLSNSGNTTLIGIYYSYVFVRSNGIWSQETTLGPSIGGVTSVALSADGNTALIGATDTLAFQKSGGTWRQLGYELVGTDPIGCLPLS